jgi:hypothetical protein
VPSFENREDPGRRIRAVDGKSKSKRGEPSKSSSVCRRSLGEQK